MATHSILLSRKSYGQRSLAGYCPWGCKRVRHVLPAKQQQQNPIYDRYYHFNMQSIYKLLTWYSAFLFAYEVSACWGVFHVHSTPPFGLVTYQALNGSIWWVAAAWDTPAPPRALRVIEWSIRPSLPTGPPKVLLSQPSNFIPTLTPVLGMLLCLEGKLSSSSGPFTLRELCCGSERASEKVPPKSGVCALGMADAACEGEFGSSLGEVVWSHYGRCYQELGGGGVWVHTQLCLLLVSCLICLSICRMGRSQL